jgi:isoleucyl-tRNA synthetase
LSAFYLDILKDRLYTSPKNAMKRKSAQTVLHILVDTMVRIMAPLLPFTAEEIWQHMPDAKGKVPSVHLAMLPGETPEFKDDVLSQRWAKIIAFRTEVAKALEEARNQKKIGHSLDAEVTVSTGNALYDVLSPYEEDLRSILIVSKASLFKDKKLASAFESSDMEGLFISVEKANAQKCDRCWVRDTTVGDIAEQPTICNRCAAALDEMGLEA